MLKGEVWDKIIWVNIDWGEREEMKKIKEELINKKKVNDVVEGGEDGRIFGIRKMKKIVIGGGRRFIENWKGEKEGRNMVKRKIGKREVLKWK